MPLSNNNGRTNQQANSQQVAKGKVRYAKSVDATGWLWVKLYPYKNPKTDDVYLCEFTKVLLLNAPKGLEKSGKTFFKILEGPYARKIATLSNGNVGKCLIQTTRLLGAKLDVKIIARTKMFSKPRGEEYNQLMAIMHFNGKKTYITLDSQVLYHETNRNSPNYGTVQNSNPLPIGTYKIRTPEYPKEKEMTSFYRTSNGGYPDLKYDTVWFPVEYSANQNSSFVHVGHLSDGCVTVYQIQNWNSIYSYLIKNRLDEAGEYVGILEIQ